MDIVSSKVAAQPVSHSLFSLAMLRLRRDKIALSCLAIVMLYLLTILMAAAGLLAKDWDEEVAVSYAPPTIIYSQNDMLPAITQEQQKEINVSAQQKIEDFLANELQDPLGDNYNRAKEYSQTISKEVVVKDPSRIFGADRWGRDILSKTIQGAQTSLIVGLGSAILATIIGTLLGALAGYYGSYIDAFCDWLYSLFNSIPYLLLILAVAAVLNSSGIKTMILIFGFTGWTSVYRLIRAETIRQRSREYIRAAEAMGVSHWRRIFRHILPNTNHIILVQISILTVAFIKSEVILSFLGFGVAVSEVSWGSMLNEAQNELLLGYWWQLTAATLAMAGLITAWSIFTDALRDALDPKLK